MLALALLLTHEPVAARRPIGFPPQMLPSYQDRRRSLDVPIEEELADRLCADELWADEIEEIHFDDCEAALENDELEWVAIAIEEDLETVDLCVTGDEAACEQLMFLLEELADPPLIEPVGMATAQDPTPHPFGVQSSPSDASSIPPTQTPQPLPTPEPSPEPASIPWLPVTALGGAALFVVGILVGRRTA